MRINHLPGVLPCRQEHRQLKLRDKLDLRDMTSVPFSVDYIHMRPSKKGRVKPLLLMLTTTTLHRVDELNMRQRTLSMDDLRM
jgi:hypothetical protein